jgi:putative hydrolase of the HAD superfamily
VPLACDDGVPAGAGFLISAVVFDLFHTLVDPEEHRPRSFDRIAEAARLLGEEEAAMRRHWDSVVAEAATTAVRPALLLARACAEPPSAEVLDAVDDALSRYQDMALLTPLPGAVDALGELRRRGLGLGLLSNAHAGDVRCWAQSPLAACFDVVVVSCFAGAMKPDAAAYRVALDGLGVAAGDAAFVGDGYSGEFVGARAAGFGMVVAVTGPVRRSGLRTAAEMESIAADADVAIDDVAQLLVRL